MTKTISIKRRLALLLVLAFTCVAQGWATSTYYAKLTATTSASAKGLVYAATTNTAPTADSQYKTSITTGNGSTSSSSSPATVTFYAWAKPARGYLFDSWSGSGASVSTKTSSGDAVTISSSSSTSGSPATGTVTANWSDATAYTITYKQPENNGQYSVRYDYTTIANNALTAGSETYNMTTSTADQAVKSYAADKVTLSTSLSSFLGWYEGDSDTPLSTDKEYTYTISKDNVTITAKFEAPKEYQASVTSNGETTQYKTIKEALTAANKLSTNPTVTLQDNITGVDEILTISKSMTLDLNGYTLSGAGGRRAPSSTSDLSKTLIAINTKGITVTITDGSTEKTGTINCTDELNHDLYAIRMDQGTLNLEGGTIHCENPMKYVSGTTRMRTYTIYGAPATTINLTGATIEAVGDYYAYGILTGGWYSGNGPAKVNVSGGKIVASAYNVPTGINIGYGDLTVTGGTIEADGTGGTWSSYGITVSAGANVQKKNEWKGTLTMSGGTVKATSTTSGARGIRVNHSVAFVNNTQEVGSEVNAEATITGGTITAETTTSWPVAVESYGGCTISGGTITATATTSDAYGVRVVDGKTTIKDGANITATAKTGTAIGAAAVADTDGSKGTAYEGELQVDGGKITATVTSGANARGIAVYAATRTITSTASGYYSGVYAAAGKATINGGTVTASASTTGGNAVYVAATSTLTNDTYGTASATPICTITGGDFKGTGASNYGDVNNAANSTACSISGGYYANAANVANYIDTETYNVYELTTSNSQYKDPDHLYYVAKWGEVTVKVAKNSDTEVEYETLEDALEAAAAGQTIVLTQNYRLDKPVTINKNVTLVIPFDEEGTSYDASLNDNNNHPIATHTKTNPYTYRMLLMGENASITVNGTLNVSAQMYSAGGSQSGGGGVNGPYGLIKMAEGSKITVNAGGKLLTWGYISGNKKSDGTLTGQVDALEGAFVTEGFQINDFRGGNSSKDAYNAGVFPFNQYYIQNIEVPMTIHYGASEKAYSSLYASSSVNYTNFVFVGSTEGLFRLSKDATLTKSYDAINDRQVYVLDGNATLSSIELSLAGLPVSSSSFVLPLTNNMTVTQKSGTLSVAADVALLPGVDVTVEEGATMDIASGKSVYVYDSQQWSGYSRNNKTTVPVTYTAINGDNSSNSNNGRAYDDAKITVQGTINAEGSLYSTESGARILCTEGAGKVVTTTKPTGTKTKQTKQSGSDGRGSTACDINVTPVQLLTINANGDSVYIQTADYPDNTTFYYGIDKNDGSTTWIADKQKTAEGGGDAKLEDLLKNVSLVEASTTAPTTYNSNVYVTYTRTFKTGWNALVLPFATTVKALGADEVVEFIGSTGDKSSVTMNFRKDTTLEANKPYMVWFESDPQELHFVAPVVPTDQPTTIDSNEAFDYVGSFIALGKKWDTTSPIKKGDYIVSASGLTRAKGGNNLSAFRAYFRAYEGMQDAKIGMAINDDEVTGIKAIDFENMLKGDGSETVGNGTMYNLSGQKVDGSYKGIVIMNGKKILMK